MFTRIVFGFIFIFQAGCAYHFGLSSRALPGGYKQIAIPVFKNMSQDVGIEMYFTDALIQKFARSQVAKVTSKDEAPLILEGTILKVETTPDAEVTNATGGLASLPTDAVLATQYRIVVTAQIRLRRKSDDKVIWQGHFSNEQVYSAPQLGRPVVNSADAIYNQSVRRHTISLLAEEMMTEAHDRITENF